MKKCSKDLSSDVAAILDSIVSNSHLECLYINLRSILSSQRELISVVAEIPLS